jgi:hypothetical protein
MQSAGSPSPCKLASRLLAVCRVQIPSFLQSHSKTTGFSTYDHIASQTAPSSKSLDSYCCRKTRHTVDSYPNSFRIAEHKLSACLQESNLLSRSVHQSEDDKQNRIVIGYLRFNATSPRTSKYIEFLYQTQSS